MRVPVVSLMVLLLTGCGGAVKKRVRMDIPPAHSLAKTASLQQLVELVNERYAAAHSLSVSDLKVKFKSESRGEGYVEEYRSANGYLVVQGAGFYLRQYSESSHQINLGCDGGTGTGVPNVDPPGKQVSHGEDRCAA